MKNMHNFSAFLPIDRFQSIVQGKPLAEEARGAALFADVSGFTPLTEMLALQYGNRRGAEELTTHLNTVYETLITQVHLYRGSVIYFSGDAITCWFEEMPGNPAVERALTAAVQMQQAMQKISGILVPDGQMVTLALKIALAAGPVRRFQVGDPAIQYLDVLAGETLSRLAEGEHLAEKGDIIVSREIYDTIGESLKICEWRGGNRIDPYAGVYNAGSYGVVGNFARLSQPSPWPDLSEDQLSRELFRPWMAPTIFERLEANKGDFVTELRPAVALFIKFSGIDYDHDQDASLKLDSYIRWLQTILVEYGGRLMDITIGDKGSYLYAAFGAPVAHQNDAERAVRIGLALLTPPPELNWVEGLQIGISGGTMRTGTVGSASRHIYGVLGDQVNMAARLMAAARPSTILVNATIQQQVAHLFNWESLPPLKVKGKSQPVQVYRLLGGKENQTLQMAQIKYGLPLVGRTAELNLIRNKLELAQKGKGQIIGICAEAGMGKSRLIAEIIRIAPKGWVQFGGECQSFGTNTPYLVWRAIWQNFFNLDPAWPLERQIQQLTVVLTEIDPALVPRLPLLGAVLNLTIPDNELTRSLEPKLRKQSLEALLVDCICARSSREPVLLILEDCHWLDQLSHDLLEVLGRELRDRPVLIVIAYRPPELEYLEAPKITALSNCTVINLTEFNAEEAAALIELKMNQLGWVPSGFSTALTRLITSRSQGNPFYIEELINYLRDVKLNLLDPRSLEKLELPNSLHSLILSRIDKLNEDQKILIKISSIIGRLFQTRWLWGVYPELGSYEKVKDNLNRLSSLDLTPLDQPEPNESYFFKHVVTREVAYESIPYQMRAPLHGQLAAYLEQEYADNLNQYVDLLAHHYYYSSNEDKKREYLRKAGEAAQANFANTSAIEYYSRLLPLLAPAGQLVIQLKLGQVLELVGQWEEAGKLYDQAVILSAQLNNIQTLGQSLSARGTLLRKRGDYNLAAQELNEAKKAFEGVADRAGISQVLLEIGEVYRLQAHYSEARTCYLESLSLAEGILDPQLSKAVRARGLKASGTAASQQGDLKAGRQLYEESLLLLKEISDKPGIAGLLNNLGIVSRHLKDYEAAQRLYEQSLAQLRDLGDRMGVSGALNNLALVAGFQGQVSTARQLLEESVAIKRQLGEKWGIANSLSSLGHLLLEQGEYEQALPIIEESLFLNRELGDNAAVAYCLEDFASLATGRGEYERALHLAGAAEFIREATGVPLSPSEKEGLERVLQPAHQALGPAVGRAWKEGRAMPLNRAVDYALQERNFN